MEVLNIQYKGVSIVIMLILITTTAFGQIDDCEKTLVFDKTYDFNGTHKTYFKDRETGVVHEHKLIIKAYKTKKTGVLMEEYQTVFGDEDGEFLNERTNFITTVSTNGERAHYYAAYGEIEPLDNSDMIPKNIVQLIVYDARSHYDEKLNEHKFVVDVEKRVIRYMESEERTQFAPQLKCSSNVSSKSVKVCVDGFVRELKDVAVCN